VRAARRQSNGAGLVHDCPFDGLPDPPGRVGGKAEATLGIELLDCTDQAQVAFLDQVEKRQAAVHITPCNLDDQPQVALDHALPRAFVTLLRMAREIDFLLGREQRRSADLAQVEACRVVTLGGGRCTDGSWPVCGLAGMRVAACTLLRCGISICMTLASHAGVMAGFRVGFLAAISQ
jgi:hypothetical protein